MNRPMCHGLPKRAACALGTIVLLAAAPHAAGAQPRIGTGETSGMLTLSDGQARGRHFDEYRYRGREGERLRIELWSTRFDPYLDIRHRGSTRPLAWNDDIDRNNRSSRITPRLPADGEYVIRVTSTPSRARATGGYRIYLQSDRDRVVVNDEGSVSPPPPPPPPPPAVNWPLRVCVVKDGTLVEVSAQYNHATQDTTYNGQPFATAFPATTGYAAGATWYVNNEPITVNGRRYVRYGGLRVIGVNEVTRAADYRGVPLFAEAGASSTPEVLYVPVRPGCEFQPYEVQ